METHRTVLFADVRDSTAITERLGDVESRQLIGALMTELSATTEIHDGTVIKTIGDEVMCSFRTPLDGVRAAIEMQRDLLSRAPIQGVLLQIGIGFNAGAVIMENDDVFGDVVVVASRLVGKAAGGQILTTARTLEEMGDLDFLTRSLGEHVVKGRGQQVHVCEVLWRGETAQLTTLAPKLFEAPRAHLELRLGAQVVRTTSDEAETLTLGRSAENSVVVPGTSASRKHAKVTSRGGRFYLSDQSTNGTYVRQTGGEEIVVHRDEILLTGSGLMRLGDPLSEEGGLDIAFETSGGG